MTVFFSESQMRDDFSGNYAPSNDFQERSTICYMAEIIKELLNISMKYHCSKHAIPLQRSGIDSDIYSNVI